MITPSLYLVLLYGPILVWCGLSYRRELRKVRSAVDAHDPELRWMQAVLAMYRGDAGDPAYWRPRDARAELRDVWLLEHAGQLRDRFDHYVQGETNPAFDLVRNLWLARLGLGAGWIDEQTSLQYVAWSRHVLCERYAGWDDLRWHIDVGRREYYGGEDKISECHRTAIREYYEYFEATVRNDCAFHYVAGPSPTTRCGTAPTRPTPSSDGACRVEDQIPLPCTACGAPMHESRGSRGVPHITCAYCGAVEQLPEEFARRVRHLRLRLVSLGAAQQRVGSFARLLVAKVKHVVPICVTVAVAIVLMLVGSGVLAARDLPTLSASREILEAVFWALGTVSPVLALLAGSLYARSRILALLCARPPERSTGRARCRCCGGLLDDGDDAFLNCGWCGAQNFVTQERACATGVAAANRMRAIDRARMAADVDLQGALALCSLVTLCGVVLALCAPKLAHGIVSAVAAML